MEIQADMGKSFEEGKVDLLNVKFTVQEIRSLFVDELGKACGGEQRPQCEH